MKKFLLRASSKISKLSTEQIEQIIKNVAETNHIYASIFNSLNVAMIICDKYWNVQETNAAGELYISQNAVVKRQILQIQVNLYIETLLIHSKIM